MGQVSRTSARVRPLVATIFLVLFSGLASAADTQSTAAPFAVASVHFEQNATDGDWEVVFKVNGGDDGLTELTIVSPDGRTVVHFKTPDTSTSGIRSFHLETPEPTDLEMLKADYAEGTYEFTGKTSSSAKLFGKSILSHQLPPTTTFTHPAPEAENVSSKGLEITWSAVGATASFVVEIEQEESSMKIKAQLPGSSTSFSVPDDFLLTGTEYKLGITTLSADGNRSTVETTFATQK